MPITRSQNPKQTKTPLTRAASKKKIEEMTPAKFLKKYGKVTKKKRAARRP